MLAANPTPAEAAAAVASAPPRPPANQQQPQRPTDINRRSLSSTQLVPGQIPIPPVSNGAVPTPVPPKGPLGHPVPPAGPGMPPFDASRSPPGSKNLKHVPCKFFRQGACQAGKACPFSHSTDPSTESAPCKYFSKGNCKFGQKCALAHILPDGRRVNRPHHGGGHLSFHRMDPGYANHRSALHNSLMQANSGNVSQHTPNHSLGGRDEFPPLPGAQPIPQINRDSQASIQDPQFTSPRNEIALSSSTRTLGPLDATLPASIDRYDYSYFAKHGPFASSVPNTFGVDSPPPSLPNSVRGEATIHALRKSAFGEEDSVDELSRSGGLGSFSERLLHSAIRPRPKIYSSSYAGPHMMSGFGASRGLNATNDDDDDVLAFEEDLVPGSLTDLLTDRERHRRQSRADEDAVSSSFRNSFKSPTSGDAFGSPPVGSPGSWGPIINRHMREDDQHISGLGHVGSPLRNSFLMSETHSASRPIIRPSGSSVSALTQSLKTTHLNGGESAPAVLGEGIRASSKQIERTTSSPRLGSGKLVPAIDEEPETQFDLEVEETGPTKQVGGFSTVALSQRSAAYGFEVHGRFYDSGRS
ncbi:hypothetical protein EX30DRAFT_64783 [Ascodesmis nigricans]|uniref:C3H1-type domain-containing protein n=1 Tax=Ascodesmis nigricans TaxID=341454 RepID=A0A4S2MUI2_9PEZI|nr:hypothetical protein EX30DRAFT_64783 [Ascodesmis nigricans]